MFFVARRATLLVPSGPAHAPERKHLFICLTDPVGKDGETLLVSVSSVQPGLHHDPTCLLYPGDHPFVQRDSFVAYRHSRIEAAGALSRGVKDGKLVPQEALDSGVFARVCLGAERSRYLAPRYLTFYIASTQNQ